MTDEGSKAEVESKADLDAIRARADAAEPGPWEFKVLHWRGGFGTKTKCLVIGSWWDSNPMPPATARFIAHAREDVPTLLALVDAQQEQITRLREKVADMECLLPALRQAERRRV